LRNRWIRLPASILFVAAILVLASSVVDADFSLSEWRYVKVVTTPLSLHGESLIKVVLDAEVYEGSSTSLADLRVVGDNAVEVPFKLTESSQPSLLNPKMRDSGRVPGHHTVFTVDLGSSGALHNEIEFQTSDINFRRDATVEVSDDGVTFAWAAESEVYDFTVEGQDFVASNTRVRYPDSTAQYLRLKIAEEDDDPLEVTGVNLSFVGEILTQEVVWPTTSIGISQDLERRATLVELDLGRPGLPSSRILLQVPEVNFYRRVDLEAKTVLNNIEEWQPIPASGEIYAYDTPKFVGKMLDVTYSEVTFRYLRLVIHDEDNQPVSLEGVEVTGLRRGLVFRAVPGRTYSLYYGNPDSRFPSYDFGRTLSYSDQKEHPQAELGPQTDNPHFLGKQPPVSERFPWLLPSVVTLAAVLIGLMLLAVVRQAKSVLPPPDLED
jgi:hypothetical protein